MLAVAEPVPTTRFSKLPPEVLMMLVAMLDALRISSSPLPDAIVSVPTVWPLAIVMSPWLVWMVVTPWLAFEIGRASCREGAAPSVAVDAVRFTVVLLIVSVMLAVAEPVPTTRFSKLPQEVLMMLAVRLEVWRETSSPLPDAIVSVPTVWPLAIVMSPWLVWMVVTPWLAF